MEVKLGSEWKNALTGEFEKPYFRELAKWVKNEYATQTIFPRGSQIFKALDSTPLSAVKVVILGQDPYHGPGQANGLCFSVNEGVPLPPSLRNIYKEIENDLGMTPMGSGDLEKWANQGVLLLNATLTVRSGMAGSHQNKGWEQFTDAVIHAINHHRTEVVYLLWGSYAIRKGAIVDDQANLVLTSPHPSPLSAHRGFFGNRHFSKANAYLKEKGKIPVKWV